VTFLWITGPRPVPTRGCKVPGNVNSVRNLHERQGMPPRTKTAMTDQHKASLAKGREQARAVRDYLEWLEWSKPARGRKRDTSPARLAEVEAQIADATSPLQRLQLVQLRHDLESASQDEDDPAEGERLRKQFVRIAKAYSKAKGISYGAWREIGVPAEVLKEAGITRSSL